MVPIRAVAESFGAKVDWDAVLRKVTITYDDIEIEFLPDYVEDVMLVRSIEKNQRKTVQLDSKPVIRNDRTYLPYRAISFNNVKTVRNNTVIIHRHFHSCTYSLVPVCGNAPAATYNRLSADGFNTGEQAPHITANFFTILKIMSCLDSALIITLRAGLRLTGQTQFLPFPSNHSSFQVPGFNAVRLKQQRGTGFRHIASDCSQIRGQKLFDAILLPNPQV